jgi:hypothetical protein
MKVANRPKHIFRRMRQTVAVRASCTLDVPDWGFCLSTEVLFKLGVPYSLKGDMVLLQFLGTTHGVSDVPGLGICISTYPWRC